MSCVFCLIKNGDIPSRKIYEDDKVLAILDISQATKGHTLVIPKEHYATLFDMPTDLYMHLQSVVQMLAKKICKNLGAIGCNILNNNGRPAGQMVDHFHVHILPRYANDDLKLEFTDHGNDFDQDEILKEILK